MNDTENLIFEETFNCNNELKILIKEFNEFISKKILNIEKLISSSMNESKIGFEKSSGNNNYNNIFNIKTINEEENEEVYDEEVKD